MAITGKGQMTIPYRIRRQIGIRPGQPIAGAIAGQDLHFTLHPRNMKPKKKGGEGRLILRASPR